jgi:hypothetical protein
VHADVVLDVHANANAPVYDLVNVHVRVDAYVGRSPRYSAGRLEAATLRASSSLWVSSRSSL